MREWVEFDPSTQLRARFGGGYGVIPRGRDFHFVPTDAREGGQREGVKMGKQNR